jgi:hypothetical protein
LVLRIATIDYEAATYYSTPKLKAAPKSLDDVDPELLRNLREARDRVVGAAALWL